MRSVLLIGLAATIACGDTGNTGNSGDTGDTGNSGDSGDSGAGAMLHFKIVVDPTQERLDNFGQPTSIEAGRAAQSPTFHLLGAHYFELAPSASTLLGEGEVLYESPVTNAGGNEAIDFDAEPKAAPGDIIHSLPLADITPGTYEWLRMSLAYQEYDVALRYQALDITGRLASFVGDNHYITTFDLNGQTVTINDEKLQGFWAFEAFGTVQQGQAPVGATTVPNPIFASSPIPAGSCVVTGAFGTPVTITGNETQDITVVVSLSSNESFEWIDTTDDGVFEPLAGETVVDMGVRGVVVSVE